MILVTRAADQRIQLGDAYRNLEEPLAWLMTGFLIARSIRGHAQIAIISMLTIFLKYGRRISRIRVWLANAIAMYQFCRLLYSKYLGN